MCNALIAACYLTKDRQYNTNDLDFVLAKGDEMYLSLITGLAHKGQHSSPHLLFAELPHTFELAGNTFFISMSDYISGYVYNTFDGLLPSLEHALETAFHLTNTALLMLNDNAICVFKTKSGTYAFLILIHGPELVLLQVMALAF